MVIVLAVDPPPGIAGDQTAASYRGSAGGSDGAVGLQPGPLWLLEPGGHLVQISISVPVIVARAGGSGATGRVGLAASAEIRSAPIFGKPICEYCGGFCPRPDRDRP